MREHLDWHVGPARGRHVNGMYIPPSNAEHDRSVIYDFIDATPLGVLVTATDEGLVATHLPLVLHRERGTQGVLAGHVARANAQHRLPPIGEALVLFSGPDAYITPSWYAAKREHGKVVPTWNYVAVHVYGRAQVFTDPQRLLRVVSDLTDKHEA